MTGDPSKAKFGRSPVTNGKRTFIEPQLRTKIGTRFADILRQAEAERGGREAMTVVACAAARQWAMLAIQTELMHAALAAGESISMEDFRQMGDCMDRQARRMGPIVKPASLSRAEHAAAFRAKRATQ